MGLVEVHFPFDISSEEDVRIALASYFRELGFMPEEMSFESQFKIRLGHNTFSVENNKSVRQASGRSDMLLVRNQQPLAIVETKAPGITLSDDDRDQGLSYARLLSPMAPFTIITNGHELKVYDTITGEELISGQPATCSWVTNGMKYKGIGENAKHWATRTLFSLDLSMLQEYCRRQTTKGMADIRGTTGDRKRYVPELYVPRDTVRDSYKTFLDTDYLSFAIVGESGVGKTNELCALAEETSHSNENLTLFYRASQLSSSITDAFAQDFIWFFQRDEPAERIFHRFSEVLQAHNVRLHLFIDGLDEFPGDFKLLRVALNTLAQNLDSTSMRIITSCKSHDWSFYTRERNESQTSFGTTVFPRNNQDELPGIELAMFDYYELHKAWTKYKQVFDINSQLLGETQAECQYPLMLRLISETYQNSHEVPEHLTDAAIFEQYWARKLNNLEDHQQQLIAEDIVSRAATQMVEQDLIELPESQFRHYLEGILAINPIYEAVMKHGLLVRRKKGDKQFYLSFPFEKLRSFTYTMKSRRWNLLSDDSEKSLEIVKAFSTRLGKDAFFFYLEISDDIGDWLCSLIDIDIAHFINISDELNILLRKSTQTSFSISKAHRFINAYNRLRNAFNSLKQNLLPYNSGEAGLWFSNTFHGYRPRTDIYPESLLFIPDELGIALFTGRADSHIYEDIKPQDVSNVLFDKLSRSLPELIAIEEINRQLAKTVSMWLLDERACPMLLIERILYIIRTAPSSWQDTPSGSYWRFLGFLSRADAEKAQCSDLTAKTGALIDIWHDDYNRNVGHVKRWYELHIRTMCILQWLAKRLGQTTSALQPLPYSYHEAYDYKNDEDYMETIKFVEQIVPHVLDNYSLLLKHNFGSSSNLFSFYQHRHARLLIEISGASLPDLRRDFLLLTYILLPSAPPGKTLVRFVPREQSIAVTAIKHMRSLDGIFAKDVTVTTMLDTVKVTETHAVVIRTQYPDHHLITSQVYQLIQEEARELFGRSSDWLLSMQSSGDRDDALLQVINRGLWL
jgi:hypothetical protein